MKRERETVHQRGRLVYQLEETPPMGRRLLYAMQFINSLIISFLFFFNCLLKRITHGCVCIIRIVVIVLLIIIISVPGFIHIVFRF